MATKKAHQNGRCSRCGKALPKFPAIAEPWGDRHGYWCPLTCRLIRHAPLGGAPIGRKPKRAEIS